jgi:hypothetical protein
VSDSIKAADGTLLKSKAEKTQRWVDYFQNLLNRPEPETLDGELFEDDGDEEIRLIPNHAPTMQEVDKALRRLKTGKSPGIDDIPPEALIHGGPDLKQRLLSLLRIAWEQNAIPQDWKDAVVVPLYKKGSKTDCGNYRGISLLSIAGKLLTSIIRERISALYEVNLREEQAGFRTGRVCTDQIFNLRQVFERRLRHGRPFGALFVDFAAAFDSVHRESLWAALRSIGIPTKLVCPKIHVRWK